MVNNPTKYNQWDVLRAFLIIGQSPMRLSRVVLSERLELGEGAMRSVLDLLKRQKLLSATQRGHALTAKGEWSFREMTKRVSIPKMVKFSEYPQLVNVAIVLRKCGDKPVGTHERDLAVREGAEGVMLLTHTGKLTVPGFRYGKPFSEIEAQLDATEGDLVIIAFAKQRRIAENAMLWIAAEIVPRAFPKALC